LGGAGRVVWCPINLCTLLALKLQRLQVPRRAPAFAAASILIEWKEHKEGGVVQAHPAFFSVQNHSSAFDVAGFRGFSVIA